MQIKEIRFNIQFEYIKDIRRYIYDIEEFLKIKNLCDIIKSVPPLPDDIEPQVARLHTVKETDDKVIETFVSQASVSILFRYKIAMRFDDLKKDDIEFLKNISKDIKDFISSKHTAFKVNYESLIIASVRRIPKDKQEIIQNYKLNLSVVENRQKTLLEIDDKHLQMVEKSFLKVYDNLKPNINHKAIRYNENNFIGWDYILVLEVNNRLIYDNSCEDSKTSLLDCDFAYTKIKESFDMELI